MKPLSLSNLTPSSSNLLSGDTSVLLVEAMAAQELDSLSGKRAKGKTPYAEKHLAQLEEFAEYSTEKGYFVLTQHRKHSPRKRVLGERAGYRQIIKGRIHWEIYLLGFSYKEHQLVWLWFTGKFVPGHLMVDHIDGDSENNKVENLRAVSGGPNQRNRKANKNSPTGENGIHIVKNRFRVQLGFNKRSYHGGHYTSLEAAIKARDALLKKLNEQGAGFTERHGKVQL